jgi:hypothetical protein
MGESDLPAVTDVRVQVAEVEQNQPPARGHTAGHERMLETVREDDYKDHHIVIRTTYRIEVDGRPVTGHLGVTNDGRVHYHAVPNLSFPSAVDLVRRLIDTFPDEFERGDGTGHDHGH